jgi:penicillin amidase
MARRIITLVVAIPVLIVGATAFTLWLTLPPAHATLHIAGLSAPVDITLDQWGIPRIHAASEPDAAAALGYLHARDRMFQMELMRRAASGRLAEIAGPRAVKIDRMARIFGERRHAEQSYATLPDNLKAILVAYAAGVNAWIDQRGRLAAPEDLVLGAPERWTPTDCLLWSETVSLWLSDNYRTELAHAALAGKIPQAKIDALWPPTADTPAPDSSVPPVRQGLLDALPAFPAPFSLPDQASNAWAVDGKHTATGAALMAGDPHLALGFPSLWYLARIETPGAVLVGATAPGVPFLVIGRNAHIGWSFTTTGIDTQDVFIEHVLPDGRYATPDGPRAFEARDEVIHVRGAADVHLTVRTSRHGPVISEGAEPVLAVQMAQFALGSPAPGLYALNHAASVADAGRAAAIMTAPMQNLTVAGPDGIGLFTTGQVPLRRGQDTDMPKDGADGLHDWTGFASGDALPHFVNPPSGTVENANERTAPPDFPVALGRDFPAPLRARRIHELLACACKVKTGTFATMQADDISVFARDVLPAMLALPRQPGLAGRAQALLVGWNAEMDRDKPQGLIFNAAIQLFTARIIAANHVQESDIGHWAGFADWLLSPPGASWCDGDCRLALGQAFHNAMDSLAATYGQDPASWRWGAAHQAVFAHPLLGELPIIGAFASRRVAVDGDDTTLFRGGSGTLGDFESHHGAAYRGVYDMADLERSRFVVTPGQSGNLLSSHAWDLLRTWADGQMIRIPATPAGISATVRLEP